MRTQIPAEVREVLAAHPDQKIIMRPPELPDRVVRSLYVSRFITNVTVVGGTYVGRAEEHFDILRKFGLKIPQADFYYDKKTERAVVVADFIDGEPMPLTRDDVPIPRPNDPLFDEYEATAQTAFDSYYRWADRRWPPFRRPYALREPGNRRQFVLGAPLPSRDPAGEQGRGLYMVDLDPLAEPFCRRALPWRWE
ncbi:MAG TPA: hypothetical protein VLF40_05315 [Candidatus Saccharimonadales bacterium]|nr:hypothetical protein [Candidatus Saccharimonadales bacterium]